MLQTSSSWRARYSRLDDDMQLRGEGWGAATPAHVQPPPQYGGGVIHQRSKLSVSAIHAMDAGQLGMRRASVTPSDAGDRDRDLTYETYRSSRMSSPQLSHGASVSPVSLDERYYKFEEYFFSEPVMILNPKYVDPKNRLNMPAICVSTQEGRTGSPVPNWSAPLGADDPHFLTTPEHECGLTEEEEMQIALDQEQWEREELERRRNEQRRAKQARRQAKLDRIAAERAQHASPTNTTTSTSRKKSGRRKGTGSKFSSSSAANTTAAAAAASAPAADRWGAPAAPTPHHDMASGHNRYQHDASACPHAERVDGRHALAPSGLPTVTPPALLLGSRAMDGSLDTAPGADTPMTTPRDYHSHLLPPDTDASAGIPSPNAQAPRRAQQHSKIPAALREQTRAGPVSPREASGSEPPRPAAAPFGPSTTPSIVKSSVERDTAGSLTPRGRRASSSLAAGGYERALAEKDERGAAGERERTHSVASHGEADATPTPYARDPRGSPTKLPPPSAARGGNSPRGTAFDAPAGSRRASASGSPSIPQTVAELSRDLALSSPRTTADDHPPTPKGPQDGQGGTGTPYYSGIMLRSSSLASDRYPPAAAVAAPHNSVADPVPFMRKGPPGSHSWSLRNTQRAGTPSVASTALTSTPPVVVSKPLHREVVRMQGSPAPAPTPPPALCTNHSAAAAAPTAESADLPRAAPRRAAPECLEPAMATPVSAAKAPVPPASATPVRAAAPAEREPRVPYGLPSPQSESRAGVPARAAPATWDVVVSPPHTPTSVGERPRAARGTAPAARHEAITVSPTRGLEGLVPAELCWETPRQAGDAVAAVAHGQSPAKLHAARRGSLLEGLLAASGKCAAAAAAVALLATTHVRQQHDAALAKARAAAQQQHLLRLRDEHTAACAQVLCVVAAAVPALALQQLADSARQAPVVTRLVRPTSLHSLNDVTMGMRLEKARFTPRGTAGERRAGADALSPAPTPVLDANTTALGVVLLIGAAAAAASDDSLTRVRRRKLEIKHSLVQRRLLGSNETTARLRVAAMELDARNLIVRDMRQAQAALMRAAVLEAKRCEEAQAAAAKVTVDWRAAPARGGRRTTVSPDGVDSTPQPLGVAPVPVPQSRAPVVSMPRTSPGRSGSMEEAPLVLCTPPRPRAPSVDDESAPPSREALASPSPSPSPVAASPRVDASHDHSAHQSAASPYGVLDTPVTDVSAIHSSMAAIPAAVDPEALVAPPAAKVALTFATPVKGAKGDANATAATPATPTPMRAFRPSLFKAEGFSLTFAEMSRLSIASPMAVLPMEGCEAGRRGLAATTTPSRATPCGSEAARTAGAARTRSASESSSRSSTSSASSTCLASPHTNFESDDGVAALAQSQRLVVETTPVAAITAADAAPAPRCSVGAGSDGEAPLATARSAGGDAGDRMDALDTARSTCDMSAVAGVHAQQPHAQEVEEATAVAKVAPPSLPAAVVAREERAQTVEEKLVPITVGAAPAAIDTSLKVSVADAPAATTPVDPQPQPVDASAEAEKDEVRPVVEPNGVAAGVAVETKAKKPIAKRPPAREVPAGCCGEGGGCSIM